MQLPPLGCTFEKKMVPVKNYEGLYSVTETGKIFSHVRNIWLKQSLMRDGYKRVCLTKDKIPKHIGVHSLVIRSFIGMPNKDENCNHINGIKSDNRLINLEYLSRSENQKHAYRLGLQKQVLKDIHPFKKKLIVYKNGIEVFSGGVRAVCSFAKIDRRTIQRKLKKGDNNFKKFMIYDNTNK